MNRRDAMKGIAGAAAVVTAPAAVIHAGNTWAAANDDAAAPRAAEESGDLYTEQYKGRTITVSKSGEKVHIDGRELHLMKLGEGAYLSSMCHYRHEPTPLAAGRQAVDELRGANLLPSAGHHHA
ncbi:bagremycin/ferroverdin biosynthesis copper chaperon BagZ/FevE [Streptomyces sp. NPDC051740]|uniref:bagremycin/ferroverdin biosynthesis copper chaperon BagZ/FevE n=1 Tax=Streptomyces sp. NPDC051740 TaxID=3365673 RepID=UPI0037A05E83